MLEAHREGLGSKQNGDIGKHTDNFDSAFAQPLAPMLNKPVPFSNPFRLIGRALLGPQASSPASVATKASLRLRAGEDACGPRARPEVQW